MDSMQCINIVQMYMHTTSIPACTSIVPQLLLLQLNFIIGKEHGTCSSSALHPRQAVEYDLVDIRYRATFYELQDIRIAGKHRKLLELDQVK